MRLRTGRIAIVAASFASGVFILYLQKQFREPRDHYEVLSLDRRATKDEIRRRHNALALQFHPDKTRAANRVGSLAIRTWRRLTGYEERAIRTFIRISEAYRVLKADDSRAAYDAELQEREARSKLGPRQHSFPFAFSCVLSVLVK